ncbi:MerR family transcriptional regulator [Nakamurella sp. GG22]
MEGDIDRTGVYSIGAVAKMVDVPAQTLRSWEDRYALIVPVRSAGGQRLYTRDHVDELRFVRDQIQSGLQPADAHRLLAERRRAKADAADPTSGARDGRDGRDDGAPLAILLAERDPYAAELAEYFLRTEGYITTIVLNGDDVTRILADSRPDLLVIDLMISGGAGLALCRDVRDTSALPILAVSAIASEDAALEAGADAFLQKPVQPLQFVSTVRDLLGTSAFLRRTASVR